MLLVELFMLALLALGCMLELSSSPQPQFQASASVDWLLMVGC